MWVSTNAGAVSTSKVHVHVVTFINLKYKEGSVALPKLALFTDAITAAVCPS
jgi:hypothetical protein